VAEKLIGWKNSITRKCITKHTHGRDVVFTSKSITYHVGKHFWLSNNCSAKNKIKSTQMLKFVLKITPAVEYYKQHNKDEVLKWFATVLQLMILRQLRQIIYLLSQDVSRVLVQAFMNYCIRCSGALPTGNCIRYNRLKMLQNVLSQEHGDAITSRQCYYTSYNNNYIQDCLSCFSIAVRPGSRIFNQCLSSCYWITKICYRQQFSCSGFLGSARE